MPNEALEVIDHTDALTLGRDPETVLAEATRAAKALAKVIESKPKKIQFGGQTYLTFEDWQTVARFYGVSVVVRSTNPVSFGDGENKVTGWEANADAILTASGQVISAASAMCLDDEPKWGKRTKYEWRNGVKEKAGEIAVPMFQLRSMAQTRAAAKALRNCLSWVVVLSGFAPTPAEEMDADDGDLHYDYDTPQQAQPAQQRVVEPQQASNPISLLAPFQKSSFLAACKKSGKKNEEILGYYGSIGIESLEEMQRKDFPAALKWAMNLE